MVVGAAFFLAPFISGYTGTPAALWTNLIMGVVIAVLGYMKEYKWAAETSASIRARVQAARDMQTRRFSNNGSSDIVCNADMRVGEIRQFCKLPEEGQSLMRAAMSQLNLSARAYHRTQSVKLARTIADLAGCEAKQAVHLAGALQYRPKLMLS